MTRQERNLNEFIRTHGRPEPLMLRTTITPLTLGYQEILERSIKNDADINFDTCKINSMLVSSDGVVSLELMVGSVSIACNTPTEGLPPHLKAQIEQLSVTRTKE